jgi:hypothetical protein
MTEARTKSIIQTTFNTRVKGTTSKQETMQPGFNVLINQQKIKSKIGRK